MSSNAPMLTPALSISIISSTLNPACSPARASFSMVLARWRPLCISLAGSSSVDVVELAALLNVSRMCGDGNIGNPPKTLCHNPSYLDAIEALRPHPSQDSLQCALDLSRHDRPEEHPPHFRCHEEEVPSGCAYLTIKGEAIQAAENSPVPRVRFALQCNDWGQPRLIVDQNRSGLNGCCHKVLPVGCELGTENG